MLNLFQHLIIQSGFAIFSFNHYNMGVACGPGYTRQVLIRW